MSYAKLTINGRQHYCIACEVPTELVETSKPCEPPDADGTELVTHKVRCPHYECGRSYELHERREAGT